MMMMQKEKDIQKMQNKIQEKVQTEAKGHEATQLKINKQELQKQSFAQKSSQQNNQ